MKKNRIILILLLILLVGSIKADDRKSEDQLIDEIIFEPVLTNNSKANDLLKYYNNNENLTYLLDFKKYKEKYIFEMNEYFNQTTDVDYVDEKDYDHDQAYIDKKLDELIKMQTSAYETIYTEILVGELNKAYEVWKGTRYLWGGDSKKGIDCSALVRRIYRQVYNYELPRVSTSQITRGEKVKRNDLKPGDILFFRPENRTNHTAVYLGNSLFINASSSKGVVLSSLDNKYWNKYFKFGVRVNTGINV